MTPVVKKRRGRPPKNPLDPRPARRMKPARKKAKKKPKRKPPQPKKPAVDENTDEAWAEEINVCWYRLWGEKKRGPYTSIVAAVEAMEAAQAKRDTRG